jgi:hypothetical protein
MGTVSEQRRDGAWTPEEDAVSERVSTEVVTRSGRAAPVEFRILPDVVQVWYRRECACVVDRTVLRTWLDEPWKPLVVDDVAFSIDRLLDSRGRVAVSLPDVLVWPLPPNTIDALTRRL